MKRLLPVLLLTACGTSEPTSSTTNLAVNIQPLTLTGVSDATYTLTVKTANGTVVWRRDDLTSSRFGDGKGALAYVGPCDASTGANPHRVELEIVGLTGDDGQPITFKNPAPLGSPIAVPATCTANSDTPVRFDLTLARDAKQGFFDVAVSFEDVFCSAKFDCAGPDLLFDAEDQRGRTLVMGFACSNGTSVIPDATLYLTDVAVECTDDLGTRKTYYIDPARGPGNTGDVTPVFFQTAVYRAGGALANAQQCFWNMAFGINEGAGSERCELVAQGTVSGTAFQDGQTPANQVYPYIDWRVPLTDGDGHVTCGSSPLDGADGRVSTKYTTPQGAVGFAHAWTCGGDVTNTPPRVTCDGSVQGVGDKQVAFIDQPGGGVTVRVGNSNPSDLYVLPDDYRLDGCCLNPCCEELPPQ